MAIEVIVLNKHFSTNKILNAKISKSHNYLRFCAYLGKESIEYSGGALRKKGPAIRDEKYWSKFGPDETRMPLKADSMPVNMAWP